jgi:hypothetical protein
VEWSPDIQVDVQVDGKELEMRGNGLNMHFSTPIDFGIDTASFSWFQDKQNEFGVK